MTFSMLVNIPLLLSRLSNGQFISLVITAEAGLFQGLQLAGVSNLLVLNRSDCTKTTPPRVLWAQPSAERGEGLIVRVWSFEWNRVVFWPSVPFQ